jgi:hypothetical protein
MTAIGWFGKFPDTIIPKKGEPFNYPWKLDNISSGASVDAFDLIVDDLGHPGKTIYITGLFNSGNDSSVLELFRAGSIRWEGRTNAVGVDTNPTFPDGEIVVVPGQNMRLTVEHWHTGPRCFRGNIFGYIK